MGKVFIIVVADDILLRKFLRMIIQADPDYVISETGDDVELLRQFKEKIPDVVLLAMFTPSLRGLNVAEKIREQYPQVKIVILTNYHNQDHFRRAMRMGVEGYVLKEEIQAVDYIINIVLQGERYITQVI